MVDAAPASLPFPGSVRQKPPTFSPKNTQDIRDMIALRHTMRSPFSDFFDLLIARNVLISEFFGPKIEKFWPVSGLR